TGPHVGKSSGHTSCSPTSSGTPVTLPSSSMRSSLGFLDCILAPPIRGSSGGGAAFPIGPDHLQQLLIFPLGRVETLFAPAEALGISIVGVLLEPPLHPL